jgi:glycogen synthase
MKILIYSPLFYPSIGGLETITSILAHEFTCLGHEVRLISETPSTDSKEFSFEIIRQPSKKLFLSLTKWCDVYFQSCVSLKGLWPLLFISRPLAITHHTWYRRDDGSYNWKDYLKQFVTHFAVNIAVSHEIAKNISAASTVIPNSYQENIFCEISEVLRNQDLVFLGRLVSDKGVNLLIDSLAQLKLRGLTPQLTIIGGGAEETNLRQQAKKLEVSKQVCFAGVKVGQELVTILNSHKIMVIPSLWDEPFGIAALEGIACGCVVVGSERGGLKDAIGRCGITFLNGNLEQLSAILFELLTCPEKLINYRENAKPHLALHTSKAIAQEYLKILETVVQ